MSNVTLAAMNHPRDLIATMRPTQWFKNLYLLTGLIFGKSWGDFSLLFSVAIAFFSFSLVSSAVYILNDIIDYFSDQHHPTKKLRPIAADKVSIPYAGVFAFFLVLAGFLAASYVSQTLFSIMGIYLLINIAYSVYLKDIPVLDVFCISSGFMLRILAGTVAVGIPPTNWLLLCGWLLALFLGFSKRRIEMDELDEHSNLHREVLAEYTLAFLDKVIAVCATGVVIAYCLYTTSSATIAQHHTENLIYTSPFVIYGLFRYILMIHNHTASTDLSKDLFKDFQLLITVMSWLVVTQWLIQW